MLLVELAILKTKSRNKFPIIKVALILPGNEKQEVQLKIRESGREGEMGGERGRDGWREGERGRDGRERERERKRWGRWGRGGRTGARLIICTQFQQI